jgi:dTDP-4-amino-4,6-dideoxygalactose transaminase
MINVTRTYLPDKEKYKSYIDRIYQSGWVTNYGELVITLEKKLGELLGVRNVILVSNGTIALQVLYKAMDLRGEVVTSPFSFVATTSSLVWEGLTPVFADIDPGSFVIDPAEVDKKITDKTSAILAVHVFSNPCDVECLGTIAREHGIKLIYDAAHAFLVKHNGVNVARFGDASTFSFHATKIFHTIEGGAIVTDDDDLARRIRLMINFGIETYDKIPELGINAKMNEFQAAMGLCMLDEVEGNILKRKAIYEHYREEFKGNPMVQLQSVRPTASINYSYFPVLLASEDILKKIVTELNKHDIAPRRYFYPSLETLPYFELKQEVPISASVADRILCLPIFESLAPETVSKIAGIINQITT